jgi:hypothetical protein
MRASGDGSTRESGGRPSRAVRNAELPARRERQRHHHHQAPLGRVRRHGAGPELRRRGVTQILLAEISTGELERSEIARLSSCVGEHPPQALGDGLALGVALAREFGLILGLEGHGRTEPADNETLDEGKDLDRCEGRRDLAFVLSVFDRREPSPVGLRAFRKRPGVMLRSSRAQVSRRSRSGLSMW